MDPSKWPQSPSAMYGEPKSTRLVVDANLLVLLVVGMKRPDLIGKDKHIKDFSPSDYDLLCGALSGLSELLVTPNVVMECSNLIGDKESEAFARDSLRRLLESDEVLVSENYVRSVGAAQRNEYKYLGVADCANLCLLDKRTALLTCDNKLADAAKRINPEPENFNHLRSFI